MLTAATTLYTQNSEDLVLSKTNYSNIRSHLMSLAEDAGKFSYAINFNGLDEMIDEHSHQSCSHHMTSCARQEDYLFELGSLMRAIESSTRDNQIPLQINLFEA